ncbi:MAG: hypothetical protein JHC87_02605 [Thermoleophilaceae bacterium]|nr:hypothetical protein [Thermoleophilaceae bacterium]
MLAFAATASARTIVHYTSESPATVRHYWTVDRMKNAVPVDTPTAKRSKPTKPGGGGSTSAATSVEVTIPPGSPLTAHGKVFFKIGSSNYVCSGTALQGDVIWTAGHCVNQGPGSYYTNFLFVPAYRDGTAPYGTFPVSTLMTTDSWRLGGLWNGDVGAAIPTVNGIGQTLGQAVVERSITFDSTRNQSYNAYGYPAASPFNGQRLRVCNTAWSRNDTSSSPATMGIPCDMTGGSSGGGWVTSGGAVASVVSYGYSGLKNVLFGPYLTGEEQQLYNAAVAAATP